MKIFRCNSFSFAYILKFILYAFVVIALYAMGDKTFRLEMIFLTLDLPVEPHG
jgi:hypothetical protein